MEDTHITKAEIAERFRAHHGRAGRWRLQARQDRVPSQEEAQAENFRKMLLAMASDLRVILIKLADRLHNMRTLDHMRPDKRRRIARETRKSTRRSPTGWPQRIYRELQEPSFRHRHPMRFGAVQGDPGPAATAAVVGKILAAIEERLPQWGIEAEVHGREKHLYSIYRKMARSVSASPRCSYLRLPRHRPDVRNLLPGARRAARLYKPVPGKFKDYIAIPQGQRLSVAAYHADRPLRHAGRGADPHPEMNHVAETGVASHWLYKEDEKPHRAAAQNAQVAAVAARAAIHLGRFQRVPRARQGRPLPRRGLRASPQGQDLRPAAGRHGGRFCYARCTPMSAIAASPGASTAN